MTSWYSMPTARDWTCPPSPGDAHAFHQSLPGYSPTPLVPVPELATELGVGRLLVKDESSRLGLPAFKVLGASWACRQVLRERPGAMLVTATDGNHGRAVARMAAHFGVAATVFVPEVMLPQTAARITAEGAKVVWVDGGYDDAVRWAAAFAADQPGRALVQDTAWAGYEQVPAWIVQGYQTLLQEVDAQLGGAPDLVTVPVGVGSLAEAVVRHYRRPAAAHPGVLSVEPDTAACVLASLTAARPRYGADRGDGDGRAQLRHRFPLRMASSARRLRRGRRRQRPGRTARRGRPRPARRLLGPSGAATLAGARAALTDPGRRAALGLDEDAVVVLLSTEGHTR